MKIDAVDKLFSQPLFKKEEIQPSDNSFLNWIGEKVNETNKQLNEADKALSHLAMGKTENLHQTMLTLEQAKISFQYLEQIRNRLMSAYQDLLREQV